MAPSDLLYLYSCSISLHKICFAILGLAHYFIRISLYFLLLSLKTSLTFLINHFFSLSQLILDILEYFIHHVSVSTTQFHTPLHTFFIFCFVLFIANVYYKSVLYSIHFTIRYSYFIFVSSKSFGAK